MQTGLFRLWLWPSLFTLALSLVRLTSEVQGWVTTASGGRGLPLGISWCMFVFGGWWGFCLSRAGAMPRVRRAWAWALVALLAIAGTVAALVPKLLGAPHSEETFALLRTTVMTIAAVTTVAAIVMFVVWPRLAFLLLLYAVPARATVVAITWLAKDRGWDTHYTKFGPMGMERDAEQTLLSAAIAQGGLWVPLTIVGGVLAGSLFVRRTK
jgi:hypothetical protein